MNFTVGCRKHVAKAWPEIEVGQEAYRWTRWRGKERQAGQKEQSMQDRRTGSREVPIAVEEMTGKVDELDSAAVEIGLAEESVGERGQRQRLTTLRCRGG